MRRRGQRTLVAFTLVELVVSLAIAGMLMTGLAAALVFSTQALPSNVTISDNVILSGRVVNGLVTELQAALWVREYSAKAITFTVADRDGDGSPERIRYSWSGTPGDALLREYNGGTATVVVADMQQFALRYDTKTLVEKYPGEPKNSGEQLLAGYTSSTNISDARVRDVQWWAQYFKPTLPSDATTWSVSRVLVMAQRDTSSAATTSMQLRLPDNDSGLPSDTTIDSASVEQLDLSNGKYYWLSTLFLAGSQIAPASGLWVAFTTTDSSSMKMQYQSAGVSQANAALAEGSGSGWQTPATNKSLIFYIYGNYDIPAADQTLTRTFVTAVGIDLQVGADADAAVASSARLFNAPEALSQMWLLDFEHDPTALDVNADDSVDWTQVGKAFDPSELSDGVWSANSELRSNPANAFTQPTVINARFRQTTTGGAGAALRINADRSGGKYAPFKARALATGTNSQSLTVEYNPDGNSPRTLVVLSDLSGEFIDLRLLIDADQDTINVNVNDANSGTFSYTPVTDTDARQCLCLIPSSGSEYASVELRVGGTGGTVSP